MFYNTCILFLKFFMCKVLGLRFFLLQSNEFFLIFFCLGPKLEIDQASQPLTSLVHLIWFKKTKNGWKLGRKKTVKLGFALLHVVPNSCWPNIWRRCMAWWQKRANLGGLQLLKEVFNIKTMLKCTLASWEMPWPCKGRMLKRLLIAHMPKPNMSGISW
jgi:hypothetical protein